MFVVIVVVKAVSCLSWCVVFIGWRTMEAG